MTYLQKIISLIIISLIIVIMAGLIIIKVVSDEKIPSTYTEDGTQLPATSDNDFCGGYFEQINRWSDMKGTYYIVYAKDTKVKYFVYKSGYKFGMTPLYNADGTLQIYQP